MSPSWARCRQGRPAWTACAARGRPHSDPKGRQGRWTASNELGWSREQRLNELLHDGHHGRQRRFGALPIIPQIDDDRATLADVHAQRSTEPGLLSMPPVEFPELLLTLGKLTGVVCVLSDDCI